VKSFSITKEQFEWMVKGLKEINKVKDCEVKERTKQITLEIEKWNLRLSKLYEDKLEGVIDERFYKNKARELRDKQYEVEAKLSNLTRVSFENVEMAIQLLDFAKDAYKFFSSIEKFEQAKFIKTISSNCFVKDGQVHLELKKPFLLLSK
jgi:hypothetical protein